MKESKTIQEYPDDERINVTINFLGHFGWELVSNQRCQEFDKQTHDGDGNPINHYATFNKLTFSREKASPWYDKVVANQEEYEMLDEFISRDANDRYKSESNFIEAYRRNHPVAVEKPSVKKIPSSSLSTFLLIAGMIAFLVLNFIVGNMVIAIVVACGLLFLGIALRIRYKKGYKQYKEIMKPYRIANEKIRQEAEALYKKQLSDAKERCVAILTENDLLINQPVQP